MKKVKKSVVLLAGISAFLIGAGVVCASNNVAKAQAETTPDFYVGGASVRLIGEPGIRFSVLMKEDKYEQMISSGKNAGVYLLPEDMLVDVENDGWEAGDFASARNAVIYDAASETNVWVDSVDAAGYKEAYVVLNDIPSESYNRPISAVAYCGDEFTQAVARSFSGVALSALNENAVTESEVSSYLLNYTAQWFNGTEEVKTETVRYGNTFQKAADPSEFGKTFLGWKTRIGTNEQSEAIWSDETYDFSQADANLVRGNLQFKAVWGDYMTYAMTKEWTYGVEVPLAESNLANGTLVEVSMKIKGKNIDVTNSKTDFYAYTTETASAEYPGVNKRLIYDPTTSNFDWTDVSFCTVVRNGKVTLQWANYGADGAVTQGQVAYFKDIVVTEETYDSKYVVPTTGNATTTLATSDLANGTNVIVTMKIKVVNFAASDGVFLYTFKDVGNSAGTRTIVEPWDANRVNAARNFTEWKEVSFETVIRNGAIEIQTYANGVNTGVANAGGQTFLFKDIDVETYDSKYVVPTTGNVIAPIAESSLANGTSVTVTMKIKVINFVASEGVFLYTFKGVEDSAGTRTIVEPWNANHVNSAKNFTAWKEVSFETVVRNGAIEIQTYAQGVSSGVAQTAGQTFLFKDIVVTAKGN